MSQRLIPRKTKLDILKIHASSALAGALLGALILGAGSRIVMRILAYVDGREAGFSIGGSLEIILYGAMIGICSGLIFPAMVSLWRSRPWGRGTIFGLVVLVGTILTLPPHIASTAAPFEQVMPLVYLLFAAPFIVYGIALRRLMIEDI